MACGTLLAGLSGVTGKGLGLGKIDKEGGANDDH